MAGGRGFGVNSFAGVGLCGPTPSPARRRKGLSAFGAAPGRRVQRALLVLLAIFGFLLSPADAVGGEPGPASAPTPASWVTWHTAHFFTACNGNCAVSLFGGPQVLTPMADIFYNSPSAPWDWKWGNAGLAGAAISRRLLTLWQALNIEPEIGVAKRFGDMHADEGWLAIYFRWIRFPWNRILRTSIAVSLGFSYAADLPPGSHGAHLLNYFSPEVTFALPNHPRYELLVQFHHRSNLWIGKAADPGWQYLTVGLRCRF